MAKRNTSAVIDLTNESDDEAAIPSTSTSALPLPHTSKERPSRKRLRSGERSKSATSSSRTSTPSTRSSSVVSTKAKSKEPSPHPQVHGLPVLNELTCPICFDLVSNAATTACGHIACANCLFDYFEAERTKNDGMPQPRNIQQARQRCQKTNGKARTKENTAAYNYTQSGQPEHIFQGPCPICRTELMGGWGEAVIPLYFKTVDTID
ncbi:hypothetical protein WALSEDRAFT_64377 [Wallemia mellicola CBS 633.66]|uniref:RING-type domain-containing protein n=2 Tax=Wallemia mellicola TaxID=1708541 RepID=I4YBT3_WALMC|nr:hypothetical protein WALSEDRAFT_64377 [Wallemia mellicola CBS 633.66]EIM21425.1 hypothetical protein WALSEDRAFT_64377 [Wallemia mellicola CBS 633.66]TIC29490.1 hypothetical protein E3Q10_02599 [Wallemia mellicola]|eukprot:XP_006958456.1 hypothetical protein WALSEDRAFT_64377 [Wallemia mellicola CBS 633.66]